MREWLEIRDFSQGMNQTNAVTGSEQPWDLQDVLLTERPELIRRGPFTDRAAGGYESAMNKIPGQVLAASTFQYLGKESIVAVTSDWVNEKWWVSVHIIDQDSEPVTKRFRIAAQPHPLGLKNEDGSVKYVGATMADIAGAWTDDAGEKADARPDAFIVTTDMGTYVISYLDQNDDDDQSSGKEPGLDKGDWFVVSSSYWPLIDADSGASSKPLLPGRLKGRGFRTCANVGGYTFLAGRFAKTSNGSGAPNPGQEASFAKAAPRRLFWSQAYNSEYWKNKPGEIGMNGGAITMPFTEAITHLTDLDGNLVIFTKNHIHTITGPAQSDPLGWTAQQRADTGTVYPRSISRYEDSIIFANADGVFQYSGYETICLTEDSIGNLYKSKFYQNVINGQEKEAPVQREVIGIVIGDYYLLSLNENTGYAFCCYLPTNSWVRFSNIPLYAASRTPAEDKRAFGFMKHGSTSRIVRLDRMFVSDGSSQSTPPGLDTVLAPNLTDRGPNLKVELRRYNQGSLGVPKLWRSIAVLYDSKALASGSGQLNLSVTASPDRDDATWTALSPLLATGSVSNPRGQMSEKRQTFAQIGNSIGIRIQETGNLGQTNIASIELGYKQLRRGRA